MRGITTGANGGAGADGAARYGTAAPVCGIRTERCGHMLQSAGVGRCARVAPLGRSALQLTIACWIPLGS